MQALKISKIKHTDFKKAVSGDPEYVKLCVDMLKEQRMIVISGVDINHIISQTQHAWKEAARNPQPHLRKESEGLTTELKKPEMIFNRFNNVFPHGEAAALKAAADLGYTKQDSND